MAVNLFTGATDSNWGTSTNWSLGTVPTAADGHDTTFDATSPNCTVNASARVCNRLTFVGYTNTITMTNTITVSGNITLGAGMNIAGASALIVNASATLTSNGKTWSNAFTTSGTSLTFTFADNWVFGGLLTATGSTLATYNGSTITCTNGFQHGIFIAGTTLAIITGGTLGGSSSGGIRLNLTINPATTVTIGTTFRFNNNTLTYTPGAGSVVTTGSTFTTNSGTLATTLNVNGIAWNNVLLGLNPGTITLTSDIQVNGTLQIGDPGSATGVNGANMYAYGSVNIATSSGVSGTATLIIAGSGTLTSSGTISMPVTINTTGTFTINSFSLGSTTITYINGTVIGTKALLANSSATLNTDGMVWGSLNLTPNDISVKTITLTSKLTVTGAITVGGLTNSAVTNNFAGTHGFVCRDFVCTPVNARTLTFVGGVNYIITNLLILANNTISLSVSATGTGRAKFIIYPNALVASWGVNFTNIDNASGYPINVFLGTLTNSSNWRRVVENIPNPTNKSVGLNQGLGNGLY